MGYTGEPNEAGGRDVESTVVEATSVTQNDQGGVTATLPDGSTVSSLREDNGGGVFLGVEPNRCDIRSDDPGKYTK